jgi:hypothetical protein
MPTNHDLALQMLERAKRDNGISVSGEFMPLAAVQAMFDEFVARVPLQDVPDQEMTIFGVKPDNISIGYHVPREDMDSSWCVYCCHSHRSGEYCGASYAHSGNALLDNDRCGCDADHHPNEIQR